MTKPYAIVENGIVSNIILWDGALNVPAAATDEEIEATVVDAAASGGVVIGGWYPPEGTEAIPITEGTGPATIGSTWGGSVFTDPPVAPAPPAPPPTAAQVLAQRDGLLTQAALRMAPLQDAVDLGDATAAEEAVLKAWKQYRVKLMRIEPQEGFPAAVVWPDAPT